MGEYFKYNYVTLNAQWPYKVKKINKTQGTISDLPKAEVIDELPDMTYIS